MDTQALVALRLQEALTQSGAADVETLNSRDLLVRPRGGTTQQGVIQVVVRVSRPDLLDVWLERGDDWFVGPFEVDVTEELDELVSVVRHVMSRTAVVRRGWFGLVRRSGRGSVSWPGGRWTAA